MKRCLLLTFPDRREVFTHEKYHPTLLEFARTFGIKISVVDADFPKLLHPKEIIKFFCDNSKNTETCRYKIIKNTIRDKILQQACDVRKYIEEQFRSKKIVNVKELLHDLSEYGVHVSTLYRHLGYVKEKLESQGGRVTKISTGCYCLKY